MQPDLLFERIAGVCGGWDRLEACRGVHDGRAVSEKRQTAVGSRGPRVLDVLGPAHVEVVAAAGETGTGTGYRTVGVILVEAVAAGDGEGVVGKGVVLNALDVVGQRCWQGVEGNCL